MKIKINLESWNLEHISTLVCTWKFRLIVINKWEEVNNYSVKPVLAEPGKNTQLSRVELSWAQSGFNFESLRKIYVDWNDLYDIWLKVESDIDSSCKSAVWSKLPDEQLAVNLPNTAQLLWFELINAGFCN